jgi:hypothetical protein
MEQKIRVFFTAVQEFYLWARMLQTRSSFDSIRHKKEGRGSVVWLIIGNNSGQETSNMVRLIPGFFHLTLLFLGYTFVVYSSTKLQVFGSLRDFPIDTAEHKL